MRVHDVGAQAHEKSIEFPDRERVLDGNLAAHFGNDDGRHALRRGEVAHVILARRHRARDEDGLVPLARKPRRQPRHVARGSADVQARDDANDLHGNLSVVRCRLQTDDMQIRYYY